MPERLQRLTLLAVVALATVNVWTGAPLLSVWVGSRVQGSGPPSMGAVAVVALVLAGLAVACVRLAGWATARYDDLTGLPAQRRQLPWLRSMRGERDPGERRGRRITAPEAVLIGCVVLGVLVFEVWFFFLSGSSLPAA